MKIKWNIKHWLQLKLALLRKKKIALFSKQAEDSKPLPLGNSKEINQAMQSITIDTLLIKTFYEILKSNTLSLLNESATQESLKTKWDDLLDEYWQRSDPDKYAMNIRRSLIQSRKLNKYTTIQAALLSISLGSEVGWNGLKAFGLSDVKRAKRELLVMETNAKIKQAKERNDEIIEHAVNFYKDVAMLEQILKREINEDRTTVAKWIELFKIASQITKQKKEAK